MTTSPDGGIHAREEMVQNKIKIQQQIENLKKKFSFTVKHFFESFPEWISPAAVTYLLNVCVDL